MHDDPDYYGPDYFRIRGMFISVTMKLWLLFAVVSIGAFFQTAQLPRNGVPVYFGIALLASAGVFVFLAWIQAIVNFRIQNQGLDTVPAHVVRTTGFFVWSVGATLLGAISVCSIWFVFYVFDYDSGVPFYTAVTRGLIGGFIFGGTSSIYSWKRVARELHGP